MGQYFDIFNFDKWQSPPSVGVGSKLGEWLFERSMNSCLITYLAAPLRLEESRHHTVTRVLSVARPTVPRHLGLLALPAEILVEIYKLADLASAAALALTNTQLLSLGLQHVHAHLLKDTALWLGDRVICLGDYMRDFDIPADFLTQQEATERRLMRPPTVSKTLLRFSPYQGPVYHKRPDVYTLGPPSEQDEDSDTERAERQDRPWASLYRFACGNFAELPYTREADVRGSKLTILGKLRGLERKLYEDLITAHYSPPGNGNYKEWVLCNLSKREYVRNDAIVDLSLELSENGTIRVRGPYSNGRVGLGHVLVTLICWSSDSTIMCQDYDEELYQGRWAGNRFEIVLQKSMRPGNWTDISDDALKLVRKLWNIE